MIYQVQHTTTYTYPGTVSVCHNVVYLRPRDSAQQVCTCYELIVLPEPGVSSHYGLFGNAVTFFAVQEPHRMLTVTARSTVEVTPRAVLQPDATPAWETVRDVLHHERSAAVLEAVQYLLRRPTSHVVRACDVMRRHRFHLASHSSRRCLISPDVFIPISCMIQATSVSTPLHDVLRARRGVCQDFAHVQIGCLRALGLAARYVSGYLATQPPPGQPRLVGTYASHAWVSVYCPGYGWLEVDPTNNMVPSDHHITVAVGRDYSDVSPIKGVPRWGPAHHAGGS